LDRIQAVINEATAQARDLARGVHPVEPEPNGLMVALRKLAEQTRSLFRVRCDFRCRQPILLPDHKIATHLFHIAQEAVTNAIKHGRPKSIRIRLTRTPDRLQLAVKDDGAGIPARPRKKSGMGLRIMHYRAAIIGATLAVQKAAGGGTDVSCSVQLLDVLLVLAIENGKPRTRTSTSRKSLRRKTKFSWIVM
jgi:signal transduction histidine kinase